MKKEPGHTWIGESRSPGLSDNPSMGVARPPLPTRHHVLVEPIRRPGGITFSGLVWYVGVETITVSGIVKGVGSLDEAIFEDDIVIFSPLKHHAISPDRWIIHEDMILATLTNWRKDA